MPHPAVRIIAATALLPWLTLAAAAPSNRPAHEIHLSTDIVFPDKDLVGKDDEYDPNLRVNFGYSYHFSDYLGLTLEGRIGALDGSGALGDVDTLGALLGLDWTLTPRAKWQWVVSGGIDRTQYDPDNGSEFYRTGASLGIGQRYVFENGVTFNWRVGAETTLTDSGPTDERFTNGFLRLGFGFPLGYSPADSDGDGVPDRRDACPGTPNGATVDERGCPSDADNDGVFDGIDRCPGTPRGARVDAQGCPLDSDGDGVFDGLDQCPGTPAGEKVDERGCPVPVPKAAPPTSATFRGEPLFTEERKVLVLRDVNFEVGKASLTAASREILDEVASSLKSIPEVRVEVAGHTDSTGSRALNQRLSQARAETVRQYLIDRGVEPHRLTARGYGPDQPVADNNTPDGRAMNRRVELVRIDQ